MYSKYSDRNDPSFHIPEHYSGCAFSKKMPNTEPKRYLEVAKPTPQEPTAPPPPPPPPPHTDPPSLPSPSNEHEHEDEHKHEHEHEHEHDHDHECDHACERHLPHPLSALSNGLDFDQMLILGLILLLWGNNEDRDIVMWLALLLLWQ